MRSITIILLVIFGGIFPKVGQGKGGSDDKIILNKMLTTKDTVISNVPEQIKIVNLQTNGSGCPLGSVQQNLSPDGQSFILYFYEYIAEIGAGISRAESRKACQVTLNLQHTPGWRFAVIQFQFRGYVSLDEGIQANQEALYYFQGDQNGLNFVEALRGPEEGTYHIIQTVEPTSLYWSSCENERAINIRTAVKLSNLEDAATDAFGMIGTDSLDGTIGTQTWNIVWEKC